MRKKVVCFLCAVLTVLSLAASYPVQAYAAEQDRQEDEIAPQYVGIAQISANMDLSNGVAYCRGTVRAYDGYTVKLVMVLKRNNVEYQRWEGYITDDFLVLYEPANITRGHVYQVVVTAYVYNSKGVLVETPSTSTGIKTY